MSYLLVGSDADFTVLQQLKTYFRVCNGGQRELETFPFWSSIIAAVSPKIREKIPGNHAVSPRSVGQNQLDLTI